MADRQTILYLLGKTGTGKSSTGNSLLAGPPEFKASASSTATTKSIDTRETGYGTWRAVVVDGPGLVGVDIGFDHQAMLQFKKVADDYTGCRHVFLIVFRYGERFTKEDSDMVRNLKKESGNDVFKRHGVVLITCRDNFEVDFENENITIEQWAKAEKGDFGKLIQECNGRVLGVDNTKRVSREGGQELLFRLKSCLADIGYGFPFQTASSRPNKATPSRPNKATPSRPNKATPSRQNETTPIRQNEIDGAGCFNFNKCSIF